MRRRRVPDARCSSVRLQPAKVAGLGYFGLAEFPTPIGPERMADWLQDFLNTVKTSETLEAIAQRLASSLNEAVPRHLRSERSGFHLAGTTSVDRAEFWFIRNVADDGEPTLGRYEAREDFQGRDAPNLPPGGIQIYRNGDIRAHVAAWEKIDEAFGVLLGTPTFREIQTSADYLSWVKFKMEAIANFYERFSENPIIGKPIDAFAFSASEFVSG